MPDLPHIIYLLSDEHSAFATGFQGDPNIRTPNLDRLASEGIWFERAYANSPICTPSRGTIFSGRHAHAGPIQNFFDVFKASSPTTATLLRQAGYHTAFFGKWHGGIVRDQMSPNVRRDPDSYPEIDYFRRTPEYHRGGFQDWYAFEINDAPFNLAYYEGHDVNPTRLPGYQTDLLTGLAMNYLAAYDKDAPLFLVLSVEAPHFPLDAPPEYQRFDPARLLTRPNFHDTPAMRANLAMYYAMLENLDDNIGRFMAHLAGLESFRTDTLTIYFSDHGEYMGSHGVFNRKEYPHEEAVRIPLIFHWPGRIPALGKQDGLFSLVDMLPTTLGLAGLEVPPFVQGMDFSPACLGEAFKGPEAVLLEMNCNPRWSLDFLDWRAILLDGWKYAYFETGHEFLFNLLEDPYEMQNLAGIEGGVKEEMRNALLALMAGTKEPYFDVLMQYGVEPETPVINVSARWRGGLAPTWGGQIVTPEMSS